MCRHFYSFSWEVESVGLVVAGFRYVHLEHCESSGGTSYHILVAPAPFLLLNVASSVGGLTETNEGVNLFSDRSFVVSKAAVFELFDGHNTVSSFEHLKNPHIITELLLNKSSFPEAIGCSRSNIFLSKAKKFIAYKLIAPL